MKVFNFDDYKKFVHEKTVAMTNKGHGQYSRIAKHLNIHTSMVSQIFSGPKHLTFEQACGLCSYFGLTELESDYFVALVQWERAGNTEAKKKCERDLSRLKAHSESLKNRLSKDVVLTDADNIFFYSHWFYAAVKLACSLPGHQTSEAIAERLSLPVGLVNKAVDFLLSSGLCVETANGMIKPGPANTHLGADSPLVGRHHQNWRIKGFEKMSALHQKDLFLTMPATLSQKDVLILRKKIIDFIEEYVQVIDSSKGETIYCFNIDWFEV